jgi:cbb3-type cytochrome oxidase subunit 3
MGDLMKQLAEAPSMFGMIGTVILVLVFLGIVYFTFRTSKPYREYMGGLPLDSGVTDTPDEEK